MNQKNAPLLSIVIPHYNSPDKLNRLLESIQLCDQIQVIVVDDLSTKNIEDYDEIRDSFENRVEFYKNTIEHKSAGGARNVGLQHVDAGWVMFADADDYFFPDGIDCVLDTIDRFSDKESVDIIYFRVDSIRESDKSESNRHIPFVSLINKFYTEQEKGHISKRAELRLRYNWEPPWGKLIRTKLIRENNIEFDEVRYSNDVMFSVKAGHYAKSVDIVNKQIYCVTEGTGTLTTGTNPDEIDIRAGVLDREMDFLFEHLSVLEKIQYFGFAEYLKRACDRDEGIVGKLYSLYARLRYGGDN